MSGFQLSAQSAQRIVAEIGGIVGQNINMMDAQGYIIASTDPARIGFLHEGARQIIEERLPELYIRAEEATATRFFQFCSQCPTPPLNILVPLD